MTEKELQAKIKNANDAIRNVAVKDQALFNALTAVMQSVEALRELALERQEHPKGE